jgi:Putative prokaryotic signal transducing protein
MDRTLIVLRRYPAQIHAELAKSALDASGIKVYIQRGSGGGLLATVDIWVRAEDAQAANAILGPEETFTS